MSNEQQSGANVSSALSHTSAATNASVDLAQPIHRSKLANAVKAAIDNYCATEYDDGHRKHLGASLIGRECSRYLWYVFRWVKHIKHDGRQQRLFNRGHREEERYIEWLEGIGATVRYFDETAPMSLLYHPESDSYRWVETAKLAKEQRIEELNVTDQRITDENDPNCGLLHSDVVEGPQASDYPQMGVSGVGGHFGGSLDAEITLPPEFGIPFPLLGEFKTQGTGRKFDALNQNGVQAEKYEHFCQMSVYGHKRGYPFGLYFAINKNDDSLHVECVQLDHALGARLEQKAERIILSPTPPQKLSETITHSKCSYCDMKGVCHQGHEYEKNCRSCKWAQPVDKGEWFCQGWQRVIPVDVIPQGCDRWEAAR